MLRTQPDSTLALNALGYSLANLTDRQQESRALIERIKSAGVPVIHFGTGASGYFRELHAAGGDVMGCDWRINIDVAWLDISYRSAIQGNLDPVALFAPLPELRQKVNDLLRQKLDAST